MDIVREAQDLLRKNRRTTAGYQYTVPSPEKYPYQWLWDSCFHAIVLATFEPDAAKQELRSLLSKQLPDGMVPHIIYWEPSELYQFDWGLPGTSTLTQPPMIAYAAWEVYRRTNDAKFLRGLYPAMSRYYRFLITKRDPHDHHLAGIINPDESGEDNSPRFDASLKVPPDISQEDHLKRRLELIDANRACHFDAELCMSRHFWIKDVPFNAILIKNLEVLGHIASLMGERDDEHFCTLHAGLMREAMRDRLFQNGIFRSTAGLDYEPIDIETWAVFAPLFADLYSREEAESLISTQLNNSETFAAPWGLRTVSKREASYRPQGFWRGPVWMAPHWFVYHGLKGYGFDKEAAALREKSITLIEHAGFREYFDPETGEGYGARDFTWGALVLDMMQS